MRFVAFAWFGCLMACREAGTIDGEPSDEIEACVANAQATTVRAEFLLGGECGSCDCTHACPVCAGDCTRVCEGGCSLDEPIELAPPSPGSYAVILRYYDGGGVERAVVCFKISVDADGTQSRSQVTGTSGCCQQ